MTLKTIITLAATPSSIYASGPADADAAQILRDLYSEVGTIEPLSVRTATRHDRDQADFQGATAFDVYVADEADGETADLSEIEPVGYLISEATKPAAPAIRDLYISVRLSMDDAEIHGTDLDIDSIEIEGTEYGRHLHDARNRLASHKIRQAEIAVLDYTDDAEGEEIHTENFELNEFLLERSFTEEELGEAWERGVAAVRGRVGDGAYRHSLLDENAADDGFACACVRDNNIEELNKAAAMALTAERARNEVEEWGQDLEDLAYDLGRAYRVLLEREREDEAEAAA